MAILWRPPGVLGVEPGVGEPAPASTLRRLFGVVAFLSVIYTTQRHTL